ncbi:hypothetical protein F5876DRAFT_89324 [Lentinula aff. lateritia]|uniref:Uncharacterized protein n=1 Tax=Lentinula aff. lateritia TaxID=2804960 RepID=A0ACC1TY84_9AGAR|nr:hypothetical protein F5876DRAFT_89324 [Lentinula aff. lateritia]
MGTTQSYLSPEALVTAAVVAGAVGFGYKQVTSSEPAHDSTSPKTGGGGGGKKGKGKKKTNTTSGTSTPITESVTPENISILPFPAVVPGQFDDGAPDSSADSGAEGKPKARKGKKKKAGKAADAQAKSSAGPDTVVEESESVVSPAAAAALADSNSSHVTNSSAKLSTKSKKKKQQSPSQDKPSASFSTDTVQQLQESTASLASLATDTDGEWTRVSHRADKIHTSSIAGGTSDVGQATSITTGSSSPVDTRTEEDDDGEDEEVDVLSGSSERHPLAKRLLPKPRKTGVEESDYPSYSRVMRVQPGDKPAAGFSWGDYEDVVGGDGPSGELDADGAEADREDDGWGVNVPTSRTATAPETMNKRQRQNAARREADKFAKADAERERIAALARHQRELDSARMEAQYGKGAGKKTPSGGMKAVIDERGKLVWD